MKRKTKNAERVLFADCDEAGTRPHFRSRTDMETDLGLGNRDRVVLLAAFARVDPSPTVTGTALILILQVNKQRKLV